jgi:hypothetical protein
MMVVRGGDDDGVEFLELKELSIVGEGPGVGEAVGGSGEPILVDIAEGGDGFSGDGIEVGATASADSDNPNSELFIGAEHGCSEGGGCGGEEGGGRGLKQGSSGESMHGGGFGGSD